MNVSPVQLRFYFLSRVSVRAPTETPLNPVRASHEALTNWEGVEITARVDFGWAEGQQDDLRKFAIRLALQIPNDESGVPYDVDLETIGYFDLLGDIAAEQREDIAKVNGANVLYGVLREVLFSLTARFPQGPVVIPTVNFFDLRQSEPKHNSSKAAAAPSESVRQ
jgi:preprotein translocase subunit SecB